MDLLIIFFAFIAMALIASHRGITTTDGMDSAEWEHRQQWYGFH
jgi:hypothetical protein